MDVKERVKLYRNWIAELSEREDKWLKEHPEESQKALPPGKFDRIPLVEVKENGVGFWEVLLDGRMVFGSGGADAQKRATKRASEILRSYGVD